MTRFDDSKRRDLLRGRDRAVCMPHERERRRRACFLALSVAFGLVAGASANAAQRQSAAQYQAAQAAQYQRARQQSQTPLQTQTRERQVNTPSNAPSRTPILSGLLNLNNQSSQPQSAAQAPFARQQSQAMTRQAPQQNQSQEPQRLGVFGTRPLLSGLKPDSQAEQRQSQDFHAQAQHSSAHVYGGGAAQYAQRFGAGAGYVPSAGALTQASSNPAEANEALSKVPWNLFPEKTRERFQKVASSPTMYRRLPMAGGRCNPELFDFFLTYPQTVVELWKQMGYDEVEMKQVGPASYVVSEKGGSSGRLTVLYQSAEVAVAHVSGVYRGAGLVRPVEGEAFLILQTRYTEDPELTPLVICRLDAFVDIKNPGVDLVARAFNSMIGKIADTNFEQTLAFIDSVCQTAEQNPRQFQSVAAQLTGLSPEARRILASKAFSVAQQARQRQQGRLVNYQLLAKANDPNPGYARILSRGSNPSYANNAAYAANMRQNASQNFNVGEEEDDFFDSNDMNASFAESGFQRSGSGLPGKTFGVVREPNFTFSDEFSLAEDDASEYSLELDDGESMMTGEEYLATQSLSSLKNDEAASSLAKIEARPSNNSRAMKLLDEEENAPETLYASTPARTLATDDNLPVGSPAVSTDDDLTLDVFELPEDEDAPAAIPLSNATRPSPRLPSTVHGLNLPGARTGTMNAAPLAADDGDEGEENNDVAEISVDENGNPVLDFTFGDESMNNEDDAAAPDEADDAPALADDGFTPHAAEPAQSYAEEAADSFDGGGWTRSVLSNSVVAPKAQAPKNTRKTTITNDEPVVERKRPVTLRYTPPLGKSDASSPVKTIQEEEESPSTGDSQNRETGKRVASYRWSPVPGAFVVKTAAIDKDENTLGSKTAKFAKPEVR